MLSSSVDTACSGPLPRLFKGRVPAAHSVITSSPWAPRVLRRLPVTQSPTRTPGAYQLHTAGWSRPLDPNHHEPTRPWPFPCGQSDVPCGEWERAKEWDLCALCAQSSVHPHKQGAPKVLMENSGFAVVPLQASTPPGCERALSPPWALLTGNAVPMGSLVLT